MAQRSSLWLDARVSPSDYDSAGQMPGMFSRQRPRGIGLGSQLGCHASKTVPVSQCRGQPEANANHGKNITMS